MPISGELFTTKKTKLLNNFDTINNQMLLIALGVNLSGADFQGINLTNSNLEYSDLRFFENLTPESCQELEESEI